MHKERRAKRPLSLLKIYTMMLDGSSDIEILQKGMQITDIVKVRNFHTALRQNVHYINAAHKNGIDLSLGKRMVNLYESYPKGEPILIFAKRSQAAYALRLILSGLSDTDILEKRINEADIDTAKSFLAIAHFSETMLLATIAKKIGISRHLACKMVKIYRDNQTEINVEIIENCMPIQITV